MPPIPALRLIAAGALAAALSTGSAGATPNGRVLTTQDRPMQSAPAYPPTADTKAEPGSDAWLQMRGETYRPGDAARQDPAEVAATARLNDEIAVRNAAAETLAARARLAFEDAQARWRAEAAAAETARAQWEADVAAAEAAHARDRAAWEAELAACRRTPACKPPL
jgi:hypothetical protein